MATDAQILEGLELFSELGQKELEQIALIAESTLVGEGEVLTRRGDVAETLYIVLSGNFMVYFKEGQAFTLHKQGELMGVFTVQTPFRYISTAVALTDGKVLTLPSRELLRLIEGNAAIGDKMMRKINAIAAEKPHLNVEETVQDDN